MRRKDRVKRLEEKVIKPEDKITEITITFINPDGSIHSTIVEIVDTLDTSL